MKLIDSDAAVKLLRKYDMYDAADLIRELPVIRQKRASKITRIINGFLESGCEKMELDVSEYMHPTSCYVSMRGYLSRNDIKDCYCYMENGGVYLVRLPGRSTDGETPTLRN